MRFFRWELRHVHIGNELVSLPKLSLDVARVVRIIGERSSDRFDVEIEHAIEIHAVGIPNVVLRPELILDALAAHQVAGMGGKERQKLKGQRLKVNLLAVLAQLTVLEVKLEGTESDH